MFLILPGFKSKTVSGLQAVVDVWGLFQAEFLQLWNEHGHKGDAYPAVLFGKSAPQGLQAQQVHTHQPVDYLYQSYT